MDIKTKFEIDDIVFLLKSVGSVHNIVLLTGRVKNIDINMGDEEVSIKYTIYVKEYHETLKLEENNLFSNHKEVVDYIFRKNNMRRYLDVNHKEEDKEDDVDEIGRILGGVVGNNRLDFDSLFRSIEGLPFYSAPPPNEEENKNGDKNKI